MHGWSAGAAGGTLDRQAGWVLDTGTRRGFSTPAPWKRNQHLPDVRDSGIGTGGTHGTGLTGAFEILEARRTVGSCGADVSTPMFGGMDWTRGGRASRYIGCSHRPDVKDARDGRKGGVVPGDGNFTGSAEPGTGRGNGFALARPVHQHDCP